METEDWIFSFFWVEMLAGEKVEKKMPFLKNIARIFQSKTLLAKNSDFLLKFEKNRKKDDSKTIESYLGNFKQNLVIEQFFD